MSKSLIKLMVILITIQSLLFVSVQAKETASISKPSEKQVYAHFVTWFKTKEYSGQWTMWNSDYKQSPHDPDVIFESGQRDLAVTSYPLTGPYDSSDPAILEYQFLLMKLSGIDGIIVDWDGRRINAYRHEALTNILPYLEKFNMKLIVCFEEWCGYWPIGTFENRDSELKAAIEEMDWMTRNFLDKPFYGIIKNKRPVLVFRKIPQKWFDADEWNVLSKKAEAENISLIFDIGGYLNFQSASDGKYFWIGDFDPKTNNSDLDFCKRAYDYFFEKNNPNSSEQIVFGGVAPGFDDTPVWGWGSVARKAPRYDGKRFELTWQMSIDNDVDVAQKITWNDWNEGTQIEPCDRFGYKYIEMNKKFSARFKGVADVVPNDILRIPLKLYNARKGLSKKQAELCKAKLDEIRDALLNEKYEKARKLAEKL